MHWRSISHRDHTSSTWISWSHCSCIGGVLHCKNSWQRKLSLFLSFAYMSQSRVCLCFKVARNVTQHYGKSTDWSSCTCTHLYLVGTLKHEVWLSSLLYLSCLLVHTTGLLSDQAFINMGQQMCQWLHLKYHFTWSGPRPISVGVGAMFAFSCFLACLFAYMLCLLICFLSCLFNCFAFIFAYALALLCWLLVRSLVSFVG